MLGDDGLCLCWISCRKQSMLIHQPQYKEDTIFILALDLYRTSSQRLYQTSSSRHCYHRT
jgi:hypothetical protein